MDSIIKSPNDKCSYRHLVLDNKLEVVLISDPEHDVCGASLSVGIGSYDNPPEHLGLAHFLEHMLFLGTSKYPKEDYFLTFIKNNGGYTNAYTAETHTTYYFEVESNFMMASIDIFSEFFISPNFNEGSVEREVNAVDSEHSKNIQNDSWRFNRLLQLMSDTDHPYHNFSTGTLETLLKPHIREAVIEFYNKYYSANIMKLVVLWDKPLDFIEEIVRQKFSPIKNKNIVVKRDNRFPISKSTMAKIIPVTPGHKIFLFWQVPSVFSHYNIKPFVYYSVLLQNEADGALIHWLIKNHYVFNVDVETYDTVEQYSIFGMMLDLTDKGFKKKQFILGAVRQFINNIINNPPVQDVYDDIRKISRINFNFLEREDVGNYVSGLSSNMLFIPAKNVISYSYIFEKWSPVVNEVIQNFGNSLSFDKAFFVFSSSSYEGQLKLTEHFYKIEYEIYEKRPKIKQNSMKFSLPNKNNYIPSSMIKIESFDIVTKYPIKEDSKNNYLELWYKKDTIFNTPQIFVTLTILNPNFTKSSINDVATDLFIKAFNNLLRSDLYYMTLANSGFSIRSGYGSIIFYFKGFPQNIEMIIDLVVEKLKHFTISQTDLEYYKKEYLSEIDEQINTGPYSLLFYHLKNKTVPHTYSFNDKSTALKTITVNNIIEIQNMMNIKCKVKCLVQGNITKSSIKKIKNAVKTFICSNNEVEVNDDFAIIELKPGEEQIFKRQNYNPNETDSAIGVFYEICSNSDPKWLKLSVCAKIFELLITGDFYYQLRTQDQTGYIVKSGLFNLGPSSHSLLTFYFAIQSSKYSPDILKGKIKLFVDTISKKVNELSYEQFEDLKNAYIDIVSNKDRNINEEINRNQYEIYTDKYMFDIKKRIVSQTKKLKFEDLKQFYQEMFASKNKKLRIVEFYPEKLN